MKKNDVLYISKLAKLTLTKDQLEIFSKQLSEIIDYFRQLNQVNTLNTEPTSQTTGLENVFREDQIESEDSLTLEDALSATHDTHNGYFEVPLVLEGKGKK